MTKGDLYHLIGFGMLGECFMDTKVTEKSTQPGTIADLRKAAEPLIKYLCENYHPHVTAIVTPTSVELLEGIMCEAKVYDFLKD